MSPLKDEYFGKKEKNNILEEAWEKTKYHGNKVRNREGGGEGGEGGEDLRQVQM